RGGKGQLGCIIHERQQLGGVIPSEGQPQNASSLLLAGCAGWAESRDLLFTCPTHRKSTQQQILRLRARPTRKTSGREQPRGRCAQDDSIKIPALMKNASRLPTCSAPCTIPSQETTT